MLLQDSNGRHVRTQELGLVEKELSSGPWGQENVESEAAMLIPLPDPVGGVVLVMGKTKRTRIIERSAGYKELTQLADPTSNRILN